MVEPFPEGMHMAIFGKLFRCLFVDFGDRIQRHSSTYRVTPPISGYVSLDLALLL